MRLPWGDELAIDVGTSNTHVCVRGAGVVVREPSVIAFEAGNRRAVAVGLEARRMIERGVEGVRVVRPVRGGVIADFDAAVLMLRHFLHRALGRRPIFAPLVVTSHPDDATPVERRALADAIHAAGGGQLVSVQRALANVLGTGMPVDSDSSQAIVDLGAGITNVGIVAMGLATCGTSIRSGGDDLDEMIRRAVRRAHGLRVSHVAAEQIKLHVGSLLPPENGQSMRVDGQPATDEGASSTDISLVDVPETLIRGLNRIVSEVVWFLEDLTPRQQAEVAANGLTLTGGGALLGGIDAYLAERLGVTVRIATDPMSCTILGLESILGSPHSVSMEGRRFRTGG
jgi:rod shape-determining protein MreB and related proteins